MKGYVKIKDILNYCDNKVKEYQELIENAKEKDISSVVYFMNQERIYKNDIPNMINELGENATVFEDSIRELNLSNATFNILEKNEISTLEQLSKLTVRDLMAIKGLGMISINNIYNEAKLKGIEIKQ